MTRRRFTDPDKWEDPWFAQLSPVAKLVWLYVTDRCDNAGVWKVNRRLAVALIGLDIDWHGVELELGDRVRPFGDGMRWWIPKVIRFQNPGGLSDRIAPHRQILRLLSEHGLDVREAWSGERVPEPLPKGSLTPRDKDKDSPSRDSRLEEGREKPPEVSGDTRARVEAPAPDPTDLTTPRAGDPPTARLRIVADTSPDIGVLDQLRFAGARIQRDDAGTWLLAVKVHGLERVVQVLQAIVGANEPAWWSTVSAWLTGKRSTSAPADGWHYPAWVKWDAEGAHSFIDGQRVPFKPTRKAADVQRQETAR